ncbi:hypothetical protein AAG906_003738 [Vitis piasezkii]
MRFDELVDSIQTYEMTIPSSQKPKDFDFKVFENEEKDIEMPYDITSDELTHMAKRINRKRKGSSKGKKVECFNCGGLGHYSQDCPSLKDAKKPIQSASITSKDARYDPNDLLAFIASKESIHGSDCDSDSDDDEFTDEQRVEFLSNLVVEHERLIKSYMKNNDILDAHKNKIYVLNVEKTNFLEKIRLLEFEHHSLLEKNNALNQEIKNNKPSSSMNENFHLGTKVLNEILDKCKTHGDKRGLGYINKDKTPSTKSSTKWYLDSGYFGHMIGDKSSFTFLKIIMGSIVIPSCPKLDGILYVEGLKENLLSISQMCDKNHKVNFHQDLCEVVNKEG